MSVILGGATDPSDPEAFGGLAYFLFEAGRSMAFPDDFALPTRSEFHRNLNKAVWALRHLLKGQSFSGYQYSNLHLEGAWRNRLDLGPRDTAISYFQIFPKSIVDSGCKLIFYLDQTIHDLADYYGYRNHLDSRWLAYILNVERAQYARADQIVFRSKWAAERAITQYELDPMKCHIVLPGANISTRGIDEKIDAKPLPKKRLKELNLVFIGKDWERKGLLRLLEAIGVFREQSDIQIRLDVVGCQEENLPSSYCRTPGVKFHGYLSKVDDWDLWASILLRADMGCLCSTAEAGGVSLREFGRFGLPAIVPDTGGSPDFYCNSSRILLKPTASSQELASDLLEFVSQEGCFLENSMIARSNRKNFDWYVAALKLCQIAKVGGIITREAPGSA